MPHFFVDPKNITSTAFKLNGSEAHHLAAVRRVKPGDELKLFDGTGAQYVVKVENVTNAEISGTVISTARSNKPSVSVNLFIAMPKGDRSDWIVEKATELGVSSITPVITKRSVTSEVTEAKLSRWERLALSASEQCLRNDVLKINKPLKFIEALKTITSEQISIIPWEGAEKTDNLSKVVSDLKTSRNICNIFIGPEGGFAIDEVETAKNAGVVAVTLGDQILRVETAALVAATLVLQTYGAY